MRAPRLQAAAAAAASKAVACPVRQDAAPLLATVPFFDNLDKHGARLLQTMFKRHEVEAGESLVDWGGMGYGDIFFVVVSGRLELVALWAGATSLSSLASQDASRSYRRPSAYSLQLGPGEFFGESALFLGRVCAIETVRALEKSTVLTITREKFKQFVEEVPSMRTTAEIREMGGMAPMMVMVLILAGLSVFAEGYALMGFVAAIAIAIDVQLDRSRTLALIAALVALAFTVWQLITLEGDFAALLWPETASPALMAIIGGLVAIGLASALLCPKPDSVCDARGEPLSRARVRAGRLVLSLTLLVGMAEGNAPAHALYPIGCVLLVTFIMGLLPRRAAKQAAD